MKKIEVLLTIRKVDSWPVNTRNTATRRVGEVRRVYYHIRDKMKDGDNISVAMVSPTKVASFRSQLGTYRKEDGLTKTLGYKTRCVKSPDGGLVLYIGRIPVGEMRNTAAPFTLVPVPCVTRIPLPPLPQPSGSGVVA